MIQDFLLYFGAVVAAYLITSRIVRRFYKFPTPSFFGSILNSRWRKNLQPPEKIVERSGIEEGMCVMELGCGPGTYTIDASRVIGTEGEIYAVDIQKAMVDKLRRKLKRQEKNDIDNIKTIVASAYELPFQDAVFNLVFMITVLPEIPDGQRALEEMYRVLKDDGTLSVSEFLIDPDYPLRRTTKKLCEKAGYKLVKSNGSFFNYTMRYKKT